MSEWCAFCREKPCLWTRYKDEVAASAEVWLEEQIELGNVERVGPRNTVRKYCYREVTFLHYGHLGQGNRVRLPACFVEGIHDLYPDVSGKYMGHKDK